jgi:UDP-glucose 4-epimerase
MAERQVVLVTGVAGYWGGRVAMRLAAEPGCQVIGLDADVPPATVQGLDTIRADVRNPALAELLRAEAVDAVCHLAFEERLLPDEQSFNRNAIGATKLLTACADAGVRKVVLRSSTAVYGARPGNPSFLAEGHAQRGSRRYGSTRDMIEIEVFCSGFHHQVPQMKITILRLANVVGRTVDTPMTRFLRTAWAPTLLGFDPMMQLIHEDDAVEALAHAVIHDRPGAFNVAAHDLLPLSKLRALAGKPYFPAFHPLAYWGAKRMAKSNPQLAQWLPMDPDMLRYPCVGDLSKMDRELGFAPKYTAEETARQFAGRNLWGQSAPEPTPLVESEEQLRDLIEERRRLREQEAVRVADPGQGGDND